MFLKLRHEFKHEINKFDALELKSRLKTVMSLDTHTNNGFYKIRSLYFDDLFDTALKENLSGVSNREKFRLRIYNYDESFILLEKKSKINGLCKKEQTRISKETAENLINGNIEKIDICEDLLLNEFVTKIKIKGLKPKTIIDYKREPYVFSAGNVRVTIDYDIKSSLKSTEFFNYELPMVPIKNSPIILEVKWDDFLPSIIKSVIQIKNNNRIAFSKYANSRMYE